MTELVHAPVKQVYDYVGQFKKHSEKASAGKKQTERSIASDQDLMKFVVRKEEK